MEEHDKLISNLQAENPREQINNSNIKTLTSQVKRLQAKIKKLERQINCVKDHPEIKPLNCCWMADSLELRERRKG